jgi:hypothetical protein
MSRSSTGKSSRRVLIRMNVCGNSCGKHVVSPRSCGQNSMEALVEAPILPRPKSRASQPETRISFRGKPRHNFCVPLPLLKCDTTWDRYLDDSCMIQGSVRCFRPDLARAYSSFVSSRISIILSRVVHFYIHSISRRTQNTCASLGD